MARIPAGSGARQQYRKWHSWLMTSAAAEELRAEELRAWTGFCIFWLPPAEETLDMGFAHLNLGFRVTLPFYVVCVLSACACLQSLLAGGLKGQGTVSLFHMEDTTPSSRSPEKCIYVQARREQAKERDFSLKAQIETALGKI